MTDTDAGRIDVQAVYESLTGFDEMAIKAKFGMPVAELDGATQSRTALFITRKREGMNDADAFKFAMGTTNGDLEGMLVKPGDLDAEGKG